MRAVAPGPTPDGGVFVARSGFGMDRPVRTKPGDTRQIEYRGMEARADADAGTIEGYLSTFWHLDSYGTAMHPGAFTKTLQERGDRLPLLLQHNPDWAIGKLENLQIDTTGLHHKSRIIDDGAEGTVTLKRLRAGVPYAHSFGFRTIRERVATDADPLIITESTPEWVKNNLPGSAIVVEEVKKYEGSIVTFPANESAIIEAVRADVGAQALAQTLEDLRAGRLDAASRALITELVAAWQAAPEGNSAPPRTDAKAPRRIDLDLVVARYGHYLEQTA